MYAVLPSGRVTNYHDERERAMYVRELHSYVSPNYRGKVEQTRRPRIRRDASLLPPPLVSERLIDCNCRSLVSLKLAYRSAER